MEYQHEDRRCAYKKISGSSRELTTALFHLRCLEIGLPIRDLELLTIGMVIDLWTESLNDKEKGEEPVREASQEDFDRF